MNTFPLILSLGGVAIVGISAGIIFFKQSKFGRLPRGKRLEKIKKSPNFIGGEFKNQTVTAMLNPETSRFDAYVRFLFGRKERATPEGPLPSQKTNLFKLDPQEDLLIWLGHSSYFMQLGGVRFLVDPVLSPTASPFSFVTRAFEGTNPYSAADFPLLDYLLITHDHWDHLNKPTLLGLKDRIGRIVCPLGVGEHLEYWGFPGEIILEGDWFDHFELKPGMEIHILPSRHFSGRSLWRQNQSLWASFALAMPGFKVYFGGDGGYGAHFSEIGEMFDGFDLAVLENGQYNDAWPYVHMQPEQCWQAALDLKAGALFPGHSAKFVISNHPWDEPLERISRIAAANNGLNSPRLLTPMIGEKVNFAKLHHTFSSWWTLTA